MTEYYKNATLSVYNAVFGGYHRRIFNRPMSSMYCKFAEFACKLQPNLSMNNTQCHNMQKNAISYFRYVEYARIRHKTFSRSAKKSIDH